jgi:hypothetical protein
MKKFAFVWMSLMLCAQAAAQVPYVWTYNPGPNHGSKWMTRAAEGDTQASGSILTDAPRPVWARVCYSIGPSDSTVTVYSENGKGGESASEVAWGGCADVFGTSIWVGNGHRQPVGGYYGIAPATPGN